jgi:hypothetical protein
MSCVADNRGDDGDLSPAARVLQELRTTMSLDDVAGYLGSFGAGGDAASRKLAEVTGDQIDLADPEHRLALISWLRSWGNRHLRRADTALTSEALRGWWEEWGSRLPRDQDTLTGLDDAELLLAGESFDDLRARPAARRSVKNTDLDVSFGETAAAKALYALRPRVFPPWDEPIRRAFGRPGGAAAYVRLLRLSAAALTGLAGRLNVPVDELPALLGRPAATPPRLVDELLLVRVPRGS